MELKKRRKMPKCMTRTMAFDLDHRKLFLRLTVVDIIIFLTFLSAVITHANLFRSLRFYEMHKSLEDLFLASKFFSKTGKVIQFENVRTAADFWKYILFFPNLLYTESIYDDNEAFVRPAEGEEKNLLSQNYLLGVPRIRQLRVRNDSCTIHPLFRRLFYECFATYDSEAESVVEFGSKNSSAWSYAAPEETDSVPIVGKTSTYGGGGFFLSLGTTKNETKKALQKLMDERWLTRETRMVFLDFAIYNANVNLFTVCRLYFEFPNIGGVLPDYQFLTALLKGPEHSVLFISGTIIAVIVFIFLLEFIRETIFYKFKYLYQFWPYVDLTIIISTIILGVWLFDLSGDLEEKIYNINPEEYTNLEHAAFRFDQYRSLVTVLLFMAYIKIFKFLNVTAITSQINDTIKKCRSEVFGFAIMFFIVFFAFSELAYLLFGDKVEDFRNFPSSMMTLLLTVLGDFDYMSISLANKFMAPIFFVTFIFFIVFVLQNMFLAIINDTYSDVKTEVVINPKKLQFVGYLREKFANCCGRRGKQSGESSITPEVVDNTMEKIGYEDGEIKAFLAKYLTKGPNGEPTLDKLDEELAKQNEDASPSQINLVKPEDFFRHQEKLEEVEATIDRITDKIELIMAEMRRSKNVRVVPKPN